MGTGWGFCPFLLVLLECQWTLHTVLHHPCPLPPAGVLERTPLSAWSTSLPNSATWANPGLLNPCAVDGLWATSRTVVCISRAGGKPVERCKWGVAWAIYIFKRSFWLQSRDRGWGSRGVGDQPRGSPLCPAAGERPRRLRLREWEERVGSPGGDSLDPSWCLADGRAAAEMGCMVVGGGPGETPGAQSPTAAAAAASGRGSPKSGSLDLSPALPAPAPPPPPVQAHLCSHFRGGCCPEPPFLHSRLRWRL